MTLQCPNCSLVGNRSAHQTTSLTLYGMSRANTSRDDTSLDVDKTSVMGVGYEFQLVIRELQKVTIPILCILGLMGNGTAVGIFRSRGLKKKSCCMYLTTKCLIDSIFLTALFVVWLDRLHVPWFHYHGVCQMIIFTTYVTAFLSVWLVVMATGENYARICHPHKVHMLCTPGKAKAVLLTLGLLSIFCYHFPLWTTYSRPSGNRSQCAPIPEYERFNNGLTYFDTSVTLILPLILVIGFMFGIFTALMAAHQRNKRMKKLGRQRNTKFLCLTPYGRVTAMLLAVSITFVVLHTPSHAIRIHLLLAVVMETKDTPTVAEFCLQDLFQLLYYSNFSTNLFTYLIFGKTFRELYVRAYCPCWNKVRTVKMPRETGGLPVANNTYSAPLDEGDDGIVTDTGVISSEMILMKTCPMVTS